MQKYYIMLLPLTCSHFFSCCRHFFTLSLAHMPPLHYICTRKRRGVSIIMVS